MKVWNSTEKIYSFIWWDLGKTQKGTRQLHEKKF